MSLRKAAEHLLDLFILLLVFMVIIRDLWTIKVFSLADIADIALFSLMGVVIASRYSRFNLTKSPYAYVWWIIAIVLMSILIYFRILPRM